MIYALIKDGAIERINIALPTTIGSTSIPAGATDLEQFGLVPIVGSEPVYDPATQRVSGPTYSFTGAVVERVYAVEDIPVEELRARAAEQIADRRWQAEVAGITVNGMAVATDRDSQSLITGAAIAAMRDPAYVCRWKTATGFVELNAEQLTAVADTVRAHVQACFDREAALLAELDAGTLTPEMLEQGWP